MVRTNTRGYKDADAQLYGPYVNPKLIREALQIIGAREVAGIRAGEIDPSVLPDLLAARTRRLARRQLAWLRRWPDALTLDLGTGPAPGALESLRELWATYAAREGSSTL